MSQNQRNAARRRRVSEPLSKQMHFSYQIYAAFTTAFGPRQQVALKIACTRCKEGRCFCISLFTEALVTRWKVSDVVPRPASTVSGCEHRNINHRYYITTSLVAKDAVNNRLSEVLLIRDLLYRKACLAGFSFRQKLSLNMWREM